MRRFGDERKTKGRLNELTRRPSRSLWLLGLVSLFNDVASEMLYPVLPIFITQVLGAPVAVLGLIEGVAEGSAAAFKPVFGRWSDRRGTRKPFVVSGYLVSTVSKVVIAISQTWGMVFVGRVLDRLGKGARTGPRDALLLGLSTDLDRGFVFGFQQALDSAGAVIGPLIALALLHNFASDIRTVLYVAIIPSVIGVVLVSFVRELRPSTETRLQPRRTAAADNASGRPDDRTRSFATTLRALPRELKVFLLASGLFALGNSSDTFLILRSKSVGLDLSLVILAYVLYNLVYSAASIPAGRLADRWGPRRVYLAGIAIYIVVYAGFTLNHTAIGVWVLFAVYGLYIAMTDSVSRALVGSFIADGKGSATLYGLQQTIISVGLVLASIVGGVLWSVVGPWATFAFAAACATLALLVLLSTGADQPRVPASL